MTRIGLISDTHGWLDERIFEHFQSCQEIWHAGDFGPGIFDELLDWTKKENKILKGVYGNIDDVKLRNECPEKLLFACEKIKVLILHIGGSPPRYNPNSRKLLHELKPQLFITGHSHILKVMYDKELNCLFINPGAAGRQGWHKMRTIVRFAIDGNEIKDCEVIELGLKSKI